jgi:hypothetical protein
MSYFKVDDILLTHPRAKIADAAGVGIWTMGGVYCSTHLTDGHIPHVIAVSLVPSARSAIKKALESGLWLPCEEHEKCYLMRAYHYDGTGGKRQPTRQEAEAAKAAARDRQRRHRGKFGAPPELDDADVTAPPSRVTEALQVDVTSAALSNPIQSRETSSLTPAEPESAKPKGKTKTGYPEDFEAKDEHRRYAHEHGLNVAAQLEAFRDHAKMTGRLGIDWDAGFRNWLKKAAEMRASRVPKAAAGATDGWMQTDGRWS